jgi:hypothetical protein
MSYTLTLKNNHYNINATKTPIYATGISSNKIPSFAI